MSALTLPSSASQSSSLLQVRLADLAGEKFKDMFYSIFDSHRSDLPRFFAPQSLVVWEGNSVSGSAQLSQLFSMLPPTKHTLTSVDTQAIDAPASAQSPSTSPIQSLLVTVSGSVVYGLDSSHPRGFYHSFIIERGANYHYISAASFRSRQLIEPDKPKKVHRHSA